MCDRKQFAIDTSNDISVATLQCHVLPKGKPAYLHANVATQSLCVSHRVGS